MHRKWRMCSQVHVIVIGASSALLLQSALGDPLGPSCLDPSTTFHVIPHALPDSSIHLHTAK